MRTLPYSPIVRFKPIILSLTLTLAAACDAEIEHGGTETGLIPVGDDVSMKPLGKDDTGCPMFQPVSKTESVVQAIHYRDKSGGFTISRDLADCVALN